MVGEQPEQGEVRTAVEGARKTDECIDASVIAKIAAMLEIDPSESCSWAQVPRGWHFPALGAATARSALRADGYPGLGVPMPDLGLPRLLQAGREVQYLRDIDIAEVLRRTSTLTQLRQKGEGDAARAIVTVRHELWSTRRGLQLLVEDQTFVLMPPSRYQHGQRAFTEVTGDVVRTVTPDAIMLFQYSALGFNSHKIHLDHRHATEVEGFPDLVVNGGLVTLLVTEFLRRELAVSPRRLKITNRLPLFCDRPITIAAAACDAGWQIRVHDDCGQVAADVELEIK